MLSGIEFEKVCKQVVENMGFEVETTKASGDGGIDLFGVVMSERANKGILMTTGYFTKSAIAFAKDSELHVDVNVSPQFFGWIFSLGKDVKVVGPEKVVEELRTKTEEFLENLNNA